MSADLRKIKKAYAEKARKDRQTIRQKMVKIFGYTERSVQYRLKGSTRMTDEEKKFLFQELKIN